MKNNLTRLFSLLLMAAMSMGVMAETAILSWNMGADGAAATAANSITGASGCAAEGFTIAITGNTGKSWSAGNGDITYDEVTYKTLKNSNGAQNTVTLPSGYEAQSVTFYAVINSGSTAAVLSEVAGISCSDEVTSEQDYSNPTIITKELENATSFTFTFKTAQVCFIAVVTYRAQPIVDPARIYAFGLTASLESTNLGILGVRSSDCANVNTTMDVTYNALDNRTVYHGDETGYTAERTYRNSIGNSQVTIKTQNGEEDGAENHNAYISFKLNIADGYKLSLTQIVSDIYVDAKSGWNYEYIIENRNGVEIYKSSVQTIAAAKSGTDHSNVIALKADAMRNLTGEITVKLVWWINSGSTMIAVKDFNVTAVVDEITSQTKTLKAIEVNGEEYDYEFEGNTISTLLHAAPSVKFYYDVKNNWSDGSQTDADDEDETIVASASGGNYVATTTLASTPYTLTFTNIDLPDVFGITRAVANVTSVAPDESMKFHLGEDAVVDPSVTGVTVTKNYGGQNAMNGPRYINWFDGTATRECYILSDEVTYRTYLYSSKTYVSELNEDCYYGFDMAITLGYKVSIQSLVSDVLRDNNTNVNSLRYRVKIYQNGTCIKTLDEVTVTNQSNKRVIDLSEEDALQDLTGNISVKMFFWAEGESTGARYMNVKDLNVAAVVEEIDPIDPSTIKEFGTTRSISGNTITSDHTKVDASVIGVTVSNLINTYEYNNSFTGNLYHGSSTAVAFAEGMNKNVFRNRVYTETYIKSLSDAKTNNAYVSFDLTVADGYQLRITNISSDVYPGDKAVPYYYSYAIENASGAEIYASDAFACSPQSSSDNLEQSINLKANDALKDLTGTLHVKLYWWVNSNGTYLMVRDLRVAAVVSETSASTTYTRTHSHMNLNTLCYPYQIDSYEGATFYTMLYKEVDGSGDALEVVLQEHVGALEAGKPYFYVPEGEELVCEYSGEYTDAGNDGNGVYGSYEDNATVTSGMYVTYNNQIIKAGSNVKLREYRAYINMAEVPLESGANPVPGRRQLRVGGNKVPTGVEGVDSHKSKLESQKVLRDGQLFILHDGCTYNAQGQLVK